MNSINVLGVPSSAAHLTWMSGWLTGSCSSWWCVGSNAIIWIKCAGAEASKIGSLRTEIEKHKIKNSYSIPGICVINNDTTVLMFSYLTVRVWPLRKNIRICSYKALLCNFSLSFHSSLLCLKFCRVSIPNTQKMCTS